MKATESWGRSVPASSTNNAVRNAAESRAATLASIETGAHMLAAALRQLNAIDTKLTRLAPRIARRLEDDQAEVGIFVAELLARYLPREHHEPPREGIRPLPARVASARTVEGWAER